MKAAGGPGKNPDGGGSVQGGLGADGGCRAPGTQDGEILSGYGQPRILHGAEKSHPIGIVADEPAVFVYHRIDGADEPGRWGQFIRQLRHPGFVRHGEIKAPDAAGGKSAHRVFQARFPHIKAEIHVIQSQKPEGFVVHQG